MDTPDCGEEDRPEDPSTTRLRPVQTNAPERGRFKRKDRFPSRDMHEPDGGSYACAWIEDSLTIHSDGNVSCGLDDPHAQRSFGNIYDASLGEIFANPELDELRQRLADGYRCKGCALYTRREPGPPPARRPRRALPTTVVVEPTVRCNLRCPNRACIPNNDATTSTRDRDDLDLDGFRLIVDQLQAALRHVYFLNYGDPFMHKQAEDMLGYLREVCPDAEVITSTNAIPLASRSRARRVLASKVNYVVVTLSGIDQESYGRYHVNGRVELALKGLRNLCEAKREMAGSDTTIIWRYLLFRWNDSVDEIERARALADEIGVDQFRLYLTHIPEGCGSYRFAPGSPSYARFREYIDEAHGYGGEHPDRYGLYGFEELPGFGRARWTSAEATIPVDCAPGFVRLVISTNRPGARPQSVIISTPWDRRKYAIRPSEYQWIVIRIPRAFRRAGSIDVRISTPDHWYPAEELQSRDLRCLGVLIKDEPVAVSGPRYVVMNLVRGLLRRRGSAVRTSTSAVTPDPDREPPKLHAGDGRFDPFARP